MRRRFSSPGQRHQHNESTMTTGFMQNISPEAANTAQCSLITPQPAEKAAEQRLPKTNLWEGITSSSAFFPSRLCLTVVISWAMTDTGVVGHWEYFEYQNQQPGEKQASRPQRPTGLFTFLQRRSMETSCGLLWTP